MTELEQTLQGKSPDLFAQYLTLQGLADDLMPNARLAFWSYTKHGSDHFRHVIQMVDSLLLPEVRQGLESEELFALLAGATWHDLGMVTEQPPDPDQVERIRETHQELGAQKIREDHNTYGVPSAYKRAVAEIVRHHRKSSIIDQVEPVLVGRCRLRLPLLCSLVRAGDELDLLDRAPVIVAETLALPEESRKHFRLGQCVAGVLPDQEAGVITIDAHADDEVTAGALADLIDKINDELAAVTAILAYHGLPEYKAELDLDQNPIVKRRVMTELTDVSTTREELAALTCFDQVAVDRALDALDGEGLATEETIYAGLSLWHLKPDQEVHKSVATHLLDTSYAMRFVRSGYNRRMVDEVVWEDLLLAFSAHFKPDEEALRKKILSASPRALQTALFSADVPRERNPLSRSVILDEALLLGLTADVYMRPDVTTELDAPRALRDLSRHVGASAPNLGQLVARAWKYRDKSHEEMAEAYIQRHSGPPMPESNVSVSVTMEFASEPAYLSPPHLMMAASEEQVPFELARPQLTGLRLDGSKFDDQVGEGAAGSWLRIMPHPKRPAMPYWRPAANILWDEDENALKIHIAPAGVYDAEQYPQRIELRMVDPVENRLKLSIVSNLTLNLSLQERQRAHESLMQLAKSNSPKMLVMNDASGELWSEIRPTPEEAQQFFDPAGDPEWVAAVQDMEGQTTTHLEVPVLNWDPLIELATQYAAAKTDRGKREILHNLEKGTEKKREVTVVGMVIRDHNGTPIIDEYVAALWGFLQPHLSDGDYWTGEPMEGAFGCWRPENPRKLTQDLRSTLEERRFQLPMNTPAGLPDFRSHVRLALSEVSVTPWELVQEAKVEIWAITDDWRTYFTALRRAENGDWAGGLDLLEALVADIPLFAEAHQAIGDLRQHNGDARGAERAYRNALTTANARQYVEGPPAIRNPDELVIGSVRSALLILELQRADSDGAMQTIAAIPDRFIRANLSELIGELEGRREEFQVSEDSYSQALAALRARCPECQDAGSQQSEE